MKCIQCGTDNTLQDRTTNFGKCKDCKHPFAFDPNTMGTHKFTDPFFAKVLTDISVNNTLFFTKKQLFYFLDGRLRQKSPLGTNLFTWLVTYFFLLGFASFFILGPLGHLIESVGAFSSLWLSGAYFLISVSFARGMFKSSQSSQLSAKHRKASAIGLSVLGWIVLVVGIVMSLIADSYVQFALSVLLGMGCLYLGRYQKQQQRNITQEFIIQPDQLHEWLTRWQQVNPPVIKLLPPPQRSLAPTAVNPDVTAYSFDRLLVCDHSAIAQLLIANNFHFENNCAILSISGYPESIFDTTMQMLRRNPALKVYALHDCKPSSLGMVQQLRTSPQWFANSEVAIIDVGLLPKHVMSSQKGGFVQRSPDSANEMRDLDADMRAKLSPEELQWLEAGNFVELESLTPQRLIQVLNRSIANSRELEPDSGDGVMFIDSGSNSIYTSDSFG